MEKADIIDISHLMKFEFSDDCAEIIDSLSDENANLSLSVRELTKSSDNLIEYLEKYYKDDLSLMALVLCLKRNVEETRNFIEE